MTTQPSAARPQTLQAVWRAPIDWLARLCSVSAAGPLDESIAARRRAAQIAVIARYAPAMMTANVLNGIVLTIALSYRAQPTLVVPWFALLLAHFTPIGYRLYTRRRRSAPIAVGPRAVRRATAHAAVLGTIWGATPILFFDPSQNDQLVIACIAVGMMCGGAFALATLPQAVLAFAVPLALGSMIGLLHGAREPIDYFVAPLIISYFIAIIRAALAHGRQFSQRVVAQAQAEMEARHDPLTGLPNRTAFEAALETACQRLRHYGERFALLYIDLDDFKLVNDRLGHQAGDQLLKQMAGRLSVCLRDMDMLARLGGDEFVLIARGVGDPQTAAALADKLADAFDPPFILESGTVDSRASVGVALAPTDGETSAALLKHADNALYEAKRDRAAAPHLYRGVDDAEARDRRALAQDMKGALARGEFFLEFQPIRDLANGRIAAAETLARWRCPGRGLVSPAQFIAAAERSGAIHELGEWIMFEACREAARWPDEVGVAVNVSAEQICDSSIVAIVEAALREARLAPGRLRIEVTESTMLAAADGTAAAIERLSDLGAAIVLDDFGTGFSSFDHIRRLPVRGVKIDRSFIRDLPDRKSLAIIQAVGHLAHALDLDVTAEGIETRTQLDYARAAGCRFAQGYLFARPLGADAIREALRDRAAA